MDVIFHQFPRTLEGVVECSKYGHELHKLNDVDWTEDFFNKLHEWASINSNGNKRGYINTYQELVEKSDTLNPDYYRFNFIKGTPGYFGYGIDNHCWGYTELKQLILDQVKELINYKNKKQYYINKKERSEQVNENLDSYSREKRM